MTLGLYTIGAAAEASGLTTYTIRMWERRYAAVVPPRTAGRNRLYSQDDVDRLLRLRRLTDAGHAIRHIARLPVDELDRLLAAMPAPPAAPLDPLAPLLARFLAAIADYDVDTAEALLVRAAALLGPRLFITQVAVPILGALGDRWEAGELRIFHEHTVSAIVRGALLGLLRAQAVRDPAHVAMTATLAGEDHQLGALMAALVAATAGWRVIVIDHQAPAVELRDAAVEAGARALLISFIGAHRDDTQRELDQLARTLPPEIALLAGGRTAPRYLERVPRARAIELDDIDATLDELARAPR
jgi:DNA-binding transcriptional MerR regulator/methylmalonyl-CoA mutase cobalamin-binding subunit